MIAVFETSVQNSQEAAQIHPVLAQISPTIRWNFDLQDCDRVLRVNCQPEPVGLVIGMVEEQGFACEELE